jgi:hypothetical protein
MSVKSFCFVIVAGLLACNSEAQNASYDSLRYSPAAEQVIAHYITAIDGQSEVYNGLEYYLHPPAYKGSAYFQGKTMFMPAIVCYRGTWYKDVPVLYDMFTDEMVSELKDSLYTLRADRTSDIYLSGHHFIYLKASESKNLPAGYYDQLYNGRSAVLVKRARTVLNRVTQQGVEVIYEDQDAIYIKKGEKYIQVNSKGSVLDVFKDKTKQLKQYLGDNKIAYKKDREASVVKLAGYYDQITN